MISRPNLLTHASSKYSRSQQNTKRRRETASNQRKKKALRPQRRRHTIRRVLTWVVAVEADRSSLAHKTVRKAVVVEAMVASVSEVEAESPTGHLPAAPESPQEWMDRVTLASRALLSILPATVASK